MEEDSNVELSCQVRGTQYPVTRITWSKDTNLLPYVSIPVYIQMCRMLRVTEVMIPINIILFLFEYCEKEFFPTILVTFKHII